MKALAWWLIPAVAFVLAVAWVSFKNRKRPPAKPQDSMAEHLRFQRAMQRQTESKPRPQVGEVGEVGDVDPTGPVPADPTNPFAAE